MIDPPTKKIARAIASRLRDLAGILYGFDGMPPSYGIKAMEYCEGVGSFCAPVTAAQPPTQRAFDELRRIGTAINRAFAEWYRVDVTLVVRSKAMQVWWEARVLDRSEREIAQGMGLSVERVIVTLREADAAVVCALNAAEYQSWLLATDDEE